MAILGRKTSGFSSRSVERRDKLSINSLDFTAQTAALRIEAGVFHSVPAADENAQAQQFTLQFQLFLEIYKSLPREWGGENCTSKEDREESSVMYTEE